MLKRFLRICSVLLTLVMLFNMIPLNAVAEEYLSAEATETVSLEQIDTTDLKIVEEVIESRSKFSKSYLLDNGLYVSAVYPQPVHYEKDGQWEEIDNTLQINSDGTYSNKAGVWDVRFPQQLTTSKDISITKDGYTLSFRMAGELRQPGNLEVAAVALRLDEMETFTLATEGETAQTFAVQSAQSAQGQIQTVDLSENRENVQFEEMVADKNVSQLKYADIYQNTDIQYDLKANQVKESIILESYRSNLRGYRYTLNVGDMIPVLQEDNSIYFYDSKQENIVMVMPAPYLIDNVNEMSYEVTVNLTQNGSQWTLSYLLPQQWLAAEERSWPVVLDPVVVADLSDNNIQDTTIVSKRIEESNYMRSTLQVGYSAADGISRILLGFDELPSLKSSDVIIKAQVALRKIGSSSGDIPVAVHKMLDVWDVETACWDSYLPFDTIIEDYVMVGDAGWYDWDVTDIVRYWYEEENLGMLIKATNAIENSGNTSSWKEFYSCNYGNDTTDPTLVIYYRNNNGVESYWDYTTVSAGEAGTGYINNYTGNFVWVHNDIGFGGNRMPVSIQHIYNLNDINKNLFGLGYGWRTNYNQRVYQWTQNTNYYVWEDSDGTDHYFYIDKETANTYKDEDGLELTLTTNGTGDAKYCIADKNGNKSYFDTYGRLKKLENNQATKSSITITYTDASGYRISTITDGASRVYRFQYDSSNLLEKIGYYSTGSTEIDSVSFDTYYQGPMEITGVGGELYSFSYYDTGYDDLLYSVCNYSGHKIVITHNEPLETWQPYRVLSVCEYDGTAKGGELSFTYSNNQTIITDVVNGNKEILQFNNFGNLLSIQDSEGRAVYAQYANSNSLDDNNPNKANQLKLSSKLQNSVGNLLTNSSFESSGSYTCTPASTAVSYQNVAYIGNKSLYMNATESSELSLGTITVAPGETYTFSAYVKLTSGTAYISLGSSQSEVFTEVREDWTRLQVSYTNNTTADAEVTAKLLCSGATQVYFDCVQLENTVTASRFNLVDNGDFRNNGNSWDNSSHQFSRVRTTTPAKNLNGYVYQVHGNPSIQKRMIQTVNISGNAGDTFVLSGWGMGKAAALRTVSDDNESQNTSTTNVPLYAIIGTFYNGNTAGKKFVLRFNPDVAQWQYGAQVMVADGAYTSIKIELAHDYNVNYVCFDGIQLFKEEFGTSYTYDDEGNVISVKDLQGKTTNYEYNTNGDIAEILQDNKAKMTYTYDNFHNVKTATSEEGITYEFTYDGYGNNTTVSITSEDGSKITTSATYSADGNRLVSSTDELGNVTKYSYNANTNVLEWVQYPNDVDGTESDDVWDTRTHYYYDSMYRLWWTDTDTLDSSFFYVEYYYNDDGTLSNIYSCTTNYEFYYCTFDLRSSVEIGSYTLAEYTYTNDRNRYLNTLDYGNGDSIQYEYDKMGRVTKQTYEDGATVSYQYDNNGALATVTDSETGIKTTYYYDFTDRMMKYVESGTDYSHSVGYEYDQLNNLTKIVDTLNGNTRETSYQYDDDNRITSVQTGDSSTSYTYDPLGRINQEQTKDGDDVVLTDSYTFSPNGNNTSTQVATHSIDTAGFDATYTYTYDDNGNILSISDGTYTTSYVYDSQNQLLRENNQKANKTWTWSYDNAGNITAKNEYAYTTGELGTAIDTVDYSYDDDSWGDLLTSYDGKAITYDGVGNMLTFDGNTYTWKHGRQLDNITKDNFVWDYTYNADGLRTSRSSNNYGASFQYYYSGDKLVRMELEENYGGSSLLQGYMEFSYDANGIPLSVDCDLNFYEEDGYYDNDGNYIDLTVDEDFICTLYYVTNLQGDVIALVDETGELILEYGYDAWGRIVRNQCYTDFWYIRYYQPLCYRGYVYDQETELYYLQSRYYDPEIGRFINADGLVSTGQGFVGNNMFAYCNNNPVNRFDPDGACSKFLWIFKIDCKQASCPDSKNYNPSPPKAAVIYDGRTSGNLGGLIGGIGFESQGEDLIEELEMSYYVEEYSFTTMDCFVDSWNSLDGEYDCIYILSHGYPGGLSCAGNSISNSGKEAYNFWDLNPVASTTLYLYSCNGATIGEGGSVASCFAQLTGGSVLAVANGSLGYIYGTHFPTPTNGGTWTVTYDTTTTFWN